MATILLSCQLITPFEIFPDGAIAWDMEGRIIYVGPAEGAEHISGKRIDLKGLTVAPGLIDIHVHGGFGITFGLGNLAGELEKYSNWAAQFGVTGFVLSITGPDPDFILRTIRAYIPLLEKDYHDAQPLGLHLEGPFINPKKHGAFNPAWIRQPSVKEMQAYLDAGKDWILQVTLAPELEDAEKVADLLSNAGIQVALGHTAADYQIASRALQGKFTHVTHTFNAQSPFHHRQPGVVGAVLDSKGATAELIADGVHVHPAGLRIMMRCLGAKRIVLITDAMPGSGLPDGSYTLLGQQVEVSNGRAQLPDGTFAGSTATLDACVRNMVELAGVQLPDAVRMAAYNPSKVIRKDDSIGSLAPGKAANIVVFDADMNVRMTFIKGDLVYEEKSNGK